MLRHFVIPGMCRGGGGGLLMSLRVQAFPLKPLLNTRAQTRAHTHAQRFPRHTQVHRPLCRDTEAQKHTHPLTPRLSLLAPERLLSPAEPSAPARPPAFSPAVFPREPASSLLVLSLVSPCLSEPPSLTPEHVNPQQTRFPCLVLQSILKPRPVAGAGNIR